MKSVKEVEEAIQKWEKTKAGAFDKLREAFLENDINKGAEAIREGVDADIIVSLLKVELEELQGPVN